MNSRWWNPWTVKYLHAETLLFICLTIFPLHLSQGGELRFLRKTQPVVAHTYCRYLDNCRFFKALAPTDHIQTTPENESFLKRDLQTFKSSKKLTVQRLWRWRYALIKRWLVESRSRKKKPRLKTINGKEAQVKSSSFHSITKQICHLPNPKAKGPTTALRQSRAPSSDYPTYFMLQGGLKTLKTCRRLYVRRQGRVYIRSIRV